MQAAVGVEAQLFPGLLVGFRAGYVLPLGWDALALEGSEMVPGAPKATLQGWSFRVFIGGGMPLSGADVRRGSDGD
ncbi:MAG: hypothetical protein RMK93_06035 [Bacteroidota bacterium]|nr:hypothetical protein [Bacteroidota bacterium]MDW8225564.1 hypothetical protein [Bacteroidota bacterium]